MSTREQIERAAVIDVCCHVAPVASVTDRQIATAHARGAAPALQAALLQAAAYFEKTAVTMREAAELVGDKAVVQ